VLSFPGESLQNLCGAVQNRAVQWRSLSNNDMDEEYHCIIILASLALNAVEKRRVD
jgi:hypothetical protein